MAIGTTRSGDGSDSATRDATHPTAATIPDTQPTDTPHQLLWRHRSSITSPEIPRGTSYLHDELGDQHRLPSNITSAPPTDPIQHGDITTLDRDNINLLIQPIVQDNPDIIILITTGPPGVDFSRLRHQPPGTDGNQGSLLQRQVEIILDLQTDWPDYLVLYLLENVVPHPDVEAQFQAITEQLQCRPYLVDAKDGGLISRPRMWWQNIRWEAAAHIVHQYTPWQTIQRFQNNIWHLHNPIAALLQPPFHTKDWETPAVVQEGQPLEGHLIITFGPTLFPIAKIWVCVHRKFSRPYRSEATNEWVFTAVWGGGLQRAKFSWLSGFS